MMLDHSRFVKMKRRIFRLGWRLDDAEVLAAQRLKSLKTWKRVAKKYRYSADLEKGIKRYYYTKFMEAQALAADRLKLLRRLEWPFDFNQCGICSESIYDGHADDCELAKELGNG